VVSVVLVAALVFTCLALIRTHVLMIPTLRVALAQRDAADTTFRRYSDAIRVRDFATAYSIGSQEFRDALSEPDFAAGQQLLEAKWGKLMSSETEAFSFVGHGDPVEWTAKVRERRHYEHGDVHLLYEFHSNGGRWELFGYKEIE